MKNKLIVHDDGLQACFCLLLLLLNEYVAQVTHILFLFTFHSYDKVITWLLQRLFIFVVITKIKLAGQRMANLFTAMGGKVCHSGVAEQQQMEEVF